MSGPVPNRTHRWILVAMAGLAALALTFYAQPSWDTLVDDAYISARYSELFAHGHGVVYNAGEPPVEGVTNLAWTLLVGLGRVFGLPMIPMLTGLGWAFGVLAIGGCTALAYTLSRGASRLEAAALAAFALALEPHLAVACTNGLESSMMVASVLWATWAVVTPSVRRPVAGLFVALLPWVRPEGLAVVAGLWCFQALRYWWDGTAPRDLPRQMLSLVAPGVASLVVLFSWRLWTYGLWLPNTYYAKVAFPLSESWNVNDQYLKPEWLTAAVMVPAWLLGLVLPPRRWERVIVAVLALGLTAIPMTVYLWMPGFRLFLPSIALTIALVASAVAWLPVWVARTSVTVLILGMLGLHHQESKRIQGYDGRHSVLPANGAQRAAEHLAAHAPEGAWLATRDAGVLAYYVGPDVKVAELHQRALTQPHPDGAATAVLKLTPENPTFFISTVQRKNADKIAYGNDKLIWRRMKVPYVYLGRVEQHYHRFYDIYVRRDANIPPLPDDIVVNRAGPQHTTR